MHRACAPAAAGAAALKNQRFPAGGTGTLLLLCGASEQYLFTCRLCGAQAGTEVEIGWHAGESHPGREKAA
jgi:hypothetical protein